MVASSDSQAQCARQSKALLCYQVGTADDIYSRQRALGHSDQDERELEVSTHESHPLDLAHNRHSYTL